MSSQAQKNQQSLPTLTSSASGEKHGQPLSLQIHSRLDSVSAEDWRRLFPNLPDSCSMVRQTQRCGIQGFDFYSLVICAGNTPILFLPLFRTRYDLLQDYQGPGSDLLRILASQWLHLFRPTVLGIGFVEGEWGEVGYDASVPEPLMEQAWQMAHLGLQRLSQMLKANVVAFVDFTPQSSQAIPTSILSQYTAIASYPYGVLSLNYTSLDDYLASLSKATRKDIRRKVKKADALEIRRTTEPSEAQLEHIFSLYQATVARSSTNFGVQDFHFFQTVCQFVPEAEYTLYYHQGKLIGFNLLTRTRQSVVDKYFGMEQETGKAMNLYFLSWLENVRYCLEHGLGSYLAGPAAEAVKCRLGTQMIPTWVYVRHQNPWLHNVFRLFADKFAYQSPIDLSADHESVDSTL